MLMEENVCVLLLLPPPTYVETYNGLNRADVFVFAVFRLMQAATVQTHLNIPGQVQSII